MVSDEGLTKPNNNVSVFGFTRRTALITLLAAVAALLVVLFVMSLALRAKTPPPNLLGEPTSPRSMGAKNAGPQWTVLTDSLGYFSVAVIGTPITNEYESEDGRTFRVLSSYHYLHDKPDDEALVLIALFATPPLGWKLISDEERFANLQSTITATQNRVILESHPTSFEHFPGMEHRIGEANGRVTISRTFLIGDNTLAVTASFMSEAEVSGDVARFFNSLRLLKSAPTP